MTKTPEEKEKKPMSKPVKYLLRVLLAMGTALVLLIGGGAGLILSINYGPSDSARDMFVLSLNETSALKFLSGMILPSEVVEEILTGNTIEEFGTVSNPNLIVIPPRTEDDTQSGEKDIEVIPLRGVTYSGRLMIVKDPSRVKVGVCEHLGDSKNTGDSIDAMLDRYEAVAGVNGGGFDDPNGKGTGSMPEGFVFSAGEMVYGTDDTKCLMVGFNQDNILVVGKMTGAEAKEKGIRDALSFGPVLVQDGKAASVKGLTLNLNPRTAIGQRADGAVLLLVIDGRQANSLGASYSDLIDIMLEYGAVNACNLDGGNSSAMYHEGELISNYPDLSNGRLIPDCFYVEKR